MFPVYAGVIPGGTVMQNLKAGVPRVCGGDPML